MKVDYLLTNGEPDARPGVLRLRVKPLEDLEYPIEMFRIDSQSIVAHGERPGLFSRNGADVNLRLPGSPEFNGVADQVLNQNDQVCSNNP
ncbi:MAG TPA: hypothetical protein VD994_20515, partial [Prosthecobacter sp.]|nr:hypothetical protein [Prosthecobacter sp.]